MLSRNRNRFSTAVKSLDRIRRSLTPTHRATSRQKPVIPHKIPVRNSESGGEERREELVIDLYFKIFLFKTEFDQTPMTFIKGKVDIFAEHGLAGNIFIHKLNNYSDQPYDSLSCRLIATQKFVQKNEVELMPHEYEVVMAGFVEKYIEPRSSSTELEVKGPWVSPPKTHPYLTLILCDEREKKILFTTHCFSFEQVISKALHKDEVDQKVY